MYKTLHFFCRRTNRTGVPQKTAGNFDVCIPSLCLKTRFSYYIYTTTSSGRWPRNFCSFGIGSMISELELAVIKRGLSQDFSILTVCLKSHYYLLHIYVYTKSRAYRRAVPQTIDSLPVGSQITMRCCTTMMVRIATTIAREHCCFNLVYIYQT